jgi:hypothetical protein
VAGAAHPAIGDILVRVGIRQECLRPAANRKSEPRRHRPRDRPGSGRDASASADPVGCRVVDRQADRRIRLWLSPAATNRDRGETGYEDRPPRSLRGTERRSNPDAPDTAARSPRRLTAPRDDSIRVTSPRGSAKPVEDFTPRSGGWPTYALMAPLQDCPERPDGDAIASNQSSSRRRWRVERHQFDCA